MIELLVRLLRPFVEPLLKLDFHPPHLPEGSALVRTLKPCEAWLTFRYLEALFQTLGQTVGLGVFMLVAVAKLGAMGWVLAGALGLVQLGVIAFALVTARVDYELRHYLVGDHSLRVAQGAMTRHEVTLTYANVQNLEVTQGPLERLFGFKALTVTTAGADEVQGSGASLHRVSLVGLDDADAVRNLVMGMLRQHRDTGLGEPLPGPATAAGFDATRLAEVRDAARELERAAWRRRASGGRDVPPQRSQA